MSRSQPITVVKPQGAERARMGEGPPDMRRQDQHRHQCGSHRPGLQRLAARPLLTATASRFTVKEVSADKGYISAKNLQVVVSAGGVPYIPFKVNTSGRGPELWRKMHHYFLFWREDFLEHYHKRSNVETVFSMIKAKFGDGLRSRSSVALVNEALCKVLCHNLCCLVSAIYELGIKPTFWAETPLAQKGAV
jgi:Transposase DDE domain